MSESFPSAEVSTFSSLLTPSPSPAEDSCPWANAWLLQPCAGIKTHSHDTEALTGWSAVSFGSTIPEKKGSTQCLCAKGLSYICADTRGWLSKTPMAHRKATGWCHSPHKVPSNSRVYLGREVSTNKTLHPVRYTEGVDCVSKNTSGVISETRFSCLHLTEEMLHINLSQHVFFLLLINTQKGWRS